MWYNLELKFFFFPCHFFSFPSGNNNFLKFSDVCNYLFYLFQIEHALTEMIILRCLSGLSLFLLIRCFSFVIDWSDGLDLFVLTWNRTFFVFSFLSEPVNTQCTWFVLMVKLHSVLWTIGRICSLTFLYLYSCSLCSKLVVMFSAPAYPQFPMIMSF